MKQKFTKDEQAAFIRRKAKDIATARLKETLILRDTPITHMTNDMLNGYMENNFLNNLDEHESRLAKHAMRSAVLWAKNHEVTYSEHDKTLRHNRAERLKTAELKAKAEADRKAKPKEHTISVDVI